MIRPLRANGVPQGVLIAANRPTFAGESRRKCPRNRSGSLERWVFGKSQGLLRRAIVAVSPVLGRVGCGRHDLGCWVARVSAGALQPESDSECPLSLQHAVAVASLRKGRLDGSPSPGRDMSRASRASFLEVSPRSRGKDEPRQGQRPATGARSRSNVPSRSVQVSRYGLPSASVGGASSRLPRFRHHLARGAAGRPSA